MNKAQKRAYKKFWKDKMNMAIRTSLVEEIKSKGRYGETFSDILERLLSENGK